MTALRCYLWRWVEVITHIVDLLWLLLTPWRFKRNGQIAGGFPLNDWAVRRYMKMFFGL